jgi:uncharacterized membrane protein AbrB (regulator of aidB expression)
MLLSGMIVACIILTSRWMNFNYPNFMFKLTRSILEHQGTAHSGCSVQGKK